jgi:hypothetical protein
MPQNKKVLSKIENIVEMSSYTMTRKTFHVNERKERLSMYDFGVDLDAFVVDTKHEKGQEVHIIDSKGYIKIYNKTTKKFITAMSGRSRQIRHYYESLNIKIDKLVDKAIKVAYERNETLNYNHI